MTERRTLVADTPCPIGRAVEMIGDRWTLLILRHATLGVTRFDEFRTDLGISDNILSNRLTRLVEAGLLTKVPYRDQQRTRQEYRLTSAGADLLPVLHDLARWGEAHTRTDKRTRPMRLIHNVCDTDLVAGEFCQHCGRTAERDEIVWLRPWRSRSPYPLAQPAST